MRTKASSDQDLLEPLTVYDEGRAFEPVPADHPEAHLSALWQLARELVQHHDVRIFEPWTHPGPGLLHASPSFRSARFASSFMRMIEVDAARLHSLPEWWNARARDGRVRLGNLSLAEPRESAGNTWHVAGRLRGPFRLRSVAVELLLWPQLKGWTRLTLDPQRRVRAGPLYFRTGHRALDALCGGLVSDL